MHTYVLHHVPRLIQKASVYIIFNRNHVPTVIGDGDTHYAISIESVILNPNCDLSGAHSIWIYDDDP